MDLLTIFLQARAQGSSWSGIIIILILLIVLFISIRKYKKYKCNLELREATNPNFRQSSSEMSLYAIANVVFWGGIICTIFCLATLTTTKTLDPTYHYSVHYDTTFNPGGLVISVGVLITSLVTSALLKVVANISETLKDINSKIK